MVNNMSIWFVLEPLLYKPEYLHLADLSRQLKIPHATLRQYLNYFEKEGILVKQIKGRLTMYKFNYSNSLITDYLQIIEKEKLIEKCQKSLLLKEIVSFIHENLHDESVLIFGSASQDIKKANDIDLLIVGKNNYKEKLKLLEKKLNIETHIINVNNFNEINIGLKNEIINKHLLINENEEFIRWMLKN